MYIANIDNRYRYRFRVNLKKWQGLVFIILVNCTITSLSYLKFEATRSASVEDEFV